MKKITPQERHRPGNQDAVSPVVGVMLMLVVTIIIAAVVSSFASGLGTTSEAAPTVSLAVNIQGSTLSQKATIENLGGEALPTKDLQIIVEYTIPETALVGDTGIIPLADAGKVLTHVIDGSLDPKNTANHLNTSADIGYPWITQRTNNEDEVTQRTADKTFGTATLVSGSTLTFDLRYFLGLGDSEPVGGKYGIKEGVPVHVSILHTPSGKTIYDKDVKVTW